MGFTSRERASADNREEKWMQEPTSLTAAAHRRLHMLREVSSIQGSSSYVDKREGWARVDSTTEASNPLTLKI